jgi:hypothetical protein
MNNIIITTPDELRAIVSEAVSGALPKTASGQSQVDYHHIDGCSGVIEDTWLPNVQSKDLQTHICRGNSL